MSSSSRRLILLATLLVVSATAQKDFYSVLQVPRSATDDDIKRSFKKLTRQYHPDAQRGLTTEAQKEAARKKFMEISDAYEVLSDSKKRETYDKHGKSGTSGDERSYLRHNLFTQDFEGEQVSNEDIEKALQGKDSHNVFAFFWSSNVPDCIDPGLEFKRVAARLKGSSVRVVALRCDEYFYLCRQMLQLPALPTALMFHASTPNRFDRYQGKLEFQSLTEFAAKYLSAYKRRITEDVSLNALIKVTPNVLKNRRFTPMASRRWIAPYFTDMVKKCYGYALTHEFVVLEYSPCFDCATELSIAIEALASVAPAFRVKKVDCQDSRNEQACAPFAQRDRAWTVMRYTRRCWFATKRPFVFSDEFCEPDAVDVFKGKYAAGDFVSFILSRQKSQIVRLKSLQRIQESNNSYAVLFTDDEQDPAFVTNYLQHWEILARRVNVYNPIVNAKGFRVIVTLLNCKTATKENACDDVRGRERPTFALYSFGLRAKNVPPNIYGRVTSAAQALKLIERDMEPLHLYILNRETYASKVTATLDKGTKRWFILFNAGQWCPPCTQVREPWRQVARTVQNSPHASKLNIGVVECDEQRDLCSSMALQNFPTMMFFAKGRAPVTYNGNRDASSMASFAIDAIDNRLLHLGFREIQQKVHSGETIVVSFTAGQWCPPCMQIGPVVKQVANRLPNVQVSETNCDEDQWTCNNFGIQGYPTLIMFHKGKRIQFESMQRTVDAIVQWIQQNMR